MRLIDMAYREWPEGTVCERWLPWYEDGVYVDKVRPLEHRIKPYQPVVLLTFNDASRIDVGAMEFSISRYMDNRWEAASVDKVGYQVCERFCRDRNPGGTPPLMDFLGYNAIGR